VFSKTSKKPEIISKEFFKIIKTYVEINDRVFYFNKAEIITLFSLFS